MRIFGYWTFDIDTGLATIAKLQDLVLQANSLESQIISMIQSKELELPNLRRACADLANFQLELRTEIKISMTTLKISARSLRMGSVKGNSHQQFNALKKYIENANHKLRHTKPIIRRIHSYGYVLLTEHAIECIVAAS